MKNFIVQFHPERREYMVLSIGGSIHYFASKKDDIANTVCRALQSAYDAGRREIQYDLKSILDIHESS